MNDEGIGCSYLSVNEWRARALCIAVPCPIFSTGRIKGAVPSVRQHLAEIKSAVGAAWQLADVDIKGDFLVEHGEQVVSGLVGQEIHTRRRRADTRRPVDKQVERQLATVGEDTSPGIVHPFQGTVGRTRLGVRAQRGIQAPALAVVRPINRVEPPVIRIENDRRVLLHTPALDGAFPGGQLRVHLGSQLSYLLGEGCGGQSGHEKGEPSHR